MRKAWFSHERGPRMGYQKFGPGPGGRGGDVFIHAWRGGGRARRGDIKFLILEVLADGPRHGYDIITELENKSNGRYRPSAGSVYPTLTMLEEGGYITGNAADGKRVFTITDAGRELLTQKPGGATPENRRRRRSPRLGDEVGRGGHAGSARERYGLARKGARHPRRRTPRDLQDSCRERVASRRKTPPGRA